MGTDKRERQKQARQAKIEELRRVDQREAARRRTVMIGAAIAAFVAFAIGFAVITNDNGDADVAADIPADGSEDPSGSTVPGDTTDTTDGSDPTETTDPGEPPPTTIAEVIAGSEPCPPADGSAEPTIDFDDTFEKCIEDGVDYVARFTTTEGEVLVDLLEEQNPNAVNNFVALARYHYYDDTLLFRTDPSIDIIQGGSPHTQDNADPGPGYTIADTGGVFQNDPATGQYVGPYTYEAGQLIYARSAGPDSSSAQFFFSTGPNVSLLDSQGTYLLFGDVTEGLDVLETIIGLHEDDDSGLGGKPSRDVTVQSVEILEF